MSVARGRVGSVTTSPLLPVFAGLPGSGKTTISRAVADRLGATFVRVDTIEAAVVAGLGPLDDDKAVGYAVAHGLTADQVRSGRPAVVDAVNAVGARGTAGTISAGGGVPTSAGWW